MADGTMMRSRLNVCAVATFITVLVAIHMLAPWGRCSTTRVETGVQLCIVTLTVVCGLVVAARTDGLSRWWRLAAVASLTMYLLTHVLRAAGLIGVGNKTADSAAAVAFALIPVLSVTALVLLGRAGGVIARWPRGSLRAPTVTNVLDGLVASASFLVLMAMGGFVHPLTNQTDVHTTPLRLIFALSELALVASAVVIAVLYDVNLPFRANYMLLAGGMLIETVSYRLATYLQYPGGERWASVGLSVGSVLVAISMLEISPSPPPADAGPDRTAWVRLILAHAGFLGIALLFAFHVISGRPVATFGVGGAATLLAVLVTARQVVAVRSLWQLTARLYWALGHDRLTGLPNRILFAQLLAEAAKDRRFVLILIDLDDFKAVNERFGYAVGDALLRAVADRLALCLSGDDTMARVGGDEFAILICGGADQGEATAEHLRLALRAPFPIQGSLVRTRASIGVVDPSTTGFPGNSDDLLRYADTSMLAGKRLGKDRVVVYQESAGARVDFAHALRTSNGAPPPGFRLVYQPIVSLPDGRPVALEVLARWTAPNGLQVAPETFVAAAEASGQGAALDALVLDLACREISAVGSDLDIHVNVGAARLGSTGFDEVVRNTLRRHGIDPKRLVVEITETVPIVDIPDAAAQIRLLNARGVRVALDDFGAGYNSLTYLHSLPIHIVKLDRSFALGSDPMHDLAVYRSVAGMCAELNLMVVAEGIETDAQADTVQTAGCSLAQGYLYGRPIPIDELRYTQLARLRSDRANG